MADRRVKASGKDRDGDITKLCNSGESWSPRVKRDAIADIENKVHTYFVVEQPGNRRVDIEVVQGANGKYLRTDPDKTTKNNLDELPDC